MNQESKGCQALAGCLSLGPSFHLIQWHLLCCQQGTRNSGRHLFPACQPPHYQQQHWAICSGRKRKSQDPWPGLETEKSQPILRHIRPWFSHLETSDKHQRPSFPLPPPHTYKQNLSYSPMGTYLSQLWDCQRIRKHHFCSAIVNFLRTSFFHPALAWKYSLAMHWDLEQLPF